MVKKIKKQLTYCKYVSNSNFLTWCKKTNKYVSVLNCYNCIEYKKEIPIKITTHVTKQNNKKISDFFSRAAH